MKYETDISKIDYIEKVKMIEVLANTNSFYECSLLCAIFRDNTDNNAEKNMYDNIIKICKTTQQKNCVLELINVRAS